MRQHCLPYAVERNEKAELQNFQEGISAPYMKNCIFLCDIHCK